MNHLSINYVCAGLQNQIPPLQTVLQQRNLCIVPHPMSLLPEMYRVTLLSTNFTFYRFSNFAYDQSKGFPECADKSDKYLDIAGNTDGKLEY